MLKIKNLCYSAVDESGTKQILKDISFEVKDNETFVITGHNGSGKSTLLKVIMGILPATSGQIIFDGQDITNMPLNERANLGLAFAFQKPVTFKGMTVKKILEIASSKHDINYFCSLLSGLGLCAREYLNRELSDKLSGGEQKRIEIATVLARDAKINLFDEPEAGIDIWSFDGLVDIFNKQKATSIIVSHQEKLMQNADRIMVLTNGEIEQIGTAKEVLGQIKTNGVCAKLRGQNGQNC